MKAQKISLIAAAVIFAGLLGDCLFFHLAIVARNYPLEDSGKRRLTAREQFDQCYGVIKPGSTN
jgi:hypothetical protein